MSFVRRYYLRKLIACSYRGQGKMFWNHYYALGCYFGWKWFFMPFRKKFRIISETFYV